MDFCRSLAFTIAVALAAFPAARGLANPPANAPPAAVTPASQHNAVIENLRHDASLADVCFINPTTGWAVGEVVVETREIAIPTTLPSGEYTLRVGLYLPDGARLLTVDAQDAFVLWRDTLNP